MIRGTKALIIIKKEIENGLIKIVHYKDLIEYWVYESKNSGHLCAETANYTVGKVSDSEIPKLKCIIVCEDKPEHIDKDLPTHFVISKGVKFDDTDYPNLTDYLCKTERPPQ